MKIVLTEPTLLKNVVSCLKDLMQEVSFDVTKDGIKLVAMDPANVAMAILDLKSASFVEYKVDKDIKMGLNLSNLWDILKRAKAEDIVSLELDEQKLKIQLKGYTNRTFTLPLIDIEEKEQKIPELSFNATVKMDSKQLSEAIEDAAVVGDSLVFEADDKTLTIDTEGELSKANIVLKENDDTKIENKQKSKSKYSIEYLQKIANASKLADNVALRFSNDYPLKADFISADKFKLSFILAPRVENE